MRFEAFLLNDELELMEARLHETWGRVDRYVVIESPTTFTGRSKPLHYAENQDRFAEYSDRIMHVVADLPKNGTSWDRERAQRDALHQVIDDCDGEDIIALCDGDELVSRAFWDDVENRVVDGTVVLPMRQHYFTLTWSTPVEGEMCRSRAAFRRDIDRASAWADGIYGLKMPNAGWHLSCLGGPERLCSKLQSFAHTELSDPSWANIENCARMIRDGVDIDPVRKWPLSRVAPQGPSWLLDEGVKKWPWLLDGGV